MEEVEVYALLLDRSREAIERVLGHFGVRESACVDEFEYPQYSNTPDVVFSDDRSILDLLAAHKNATYLIHWNMAASGSKIEVRQAIAGYTSDGGVIVGMVVPESHAQATLEEFQKVFGVEWAVVAGEEAPPGDASEFRDICRSATAPRLVEGRLVLATEDDATIADSQNH